MVYNVAQRIALTVWLRLAPGKPIVCLDNHYRDGGQGDAVLRAAAEAGLRVPVLRFGVETVPECGDNLEVLRRHGLDSASVAERIAKQLGTGR